MYHIQDKESYKKTAIKAADWLFGTLNKEGVFPPISLKTGIPKERIKRKCGDPTVTTLPPTLAKA